MREEAEQNRLAGTGRAPLQTKNYAQSLQAGAVALDKLRIVRHAFMRRLRGPTLLSFGHATEGGVAGAGSDGVITIGAGVGSDGVIGAGAGFGARFLVFALLAGFAFFIPFFFFSAPGLRALPSWISLLSWISLPLSISRIG